MHRELRTRMTGDKKYHILEPTISTDAGPDFHSKVYNEVRLNYQMGPADFQGHKELLPYSEAQCRLEVPFTRELEKPQDTANTYESKSSIQFDSLHHYGNNHSSEHRKDQSPVAIEQWSFPIKFIIK
jgi:hypothetical protein